MEEIKCISTSTIPEKFGVIKAWLKMNGIEFSSDSDSVGGHYWTHIKYKLTSKQLEDLLLYLEAAEVLFDNSHVII